MGLVNRRIIATHVDRMLLGGVVRLLGFLCFLSSFDALQDIQESGHDSNEGGSVIMEDIEDQTYM